MVKEAGKEGERKGGKEGRQSRNFKKEESIGKSKGEFERILEKMEPVRNSNIIVEVKYLKSLDVIKEDNKM